MSLLLDKTGHFVGIQGNRKDGLQINPHDFLLYSTEVSLFISRAFVLELELFDGKSLSFLLSGVFVKIGRLRIFTTFLTILLSLESPEVVISIGTHTGTSIGASHVIFDLSQTPARRVDLGPDCCARLLFSGFR